MNFLLRSTWISSPYLAVVATRQGRELSGVSGSCPRTPESGSGESDGTDARESGCGAGDARWNSTRRAHSHFPNSTRGQPENDKLIEQLPSWAVGKPRVVLPSDAHLSPIRAETVVYAPGAGKSR